MFAILRIVVPLVVIFLSSTAFAADAASAAPMGYGALLARMMLMLGVVCLLAVLSLRWGLKRYVNPASQNQALAVVARLPVEPRRTLLVVRVASRHLLIASSETGFTALGELSAEDAQALGQTTQG
jgi:flagellar biogenesis protein FliO